MYASPLSTPYSGDQTPWVGYELLQSDFDDGLLVHQTLVQARLNTLQGLGVTLFNTELHTHHYAPDKGNNDYYVTTLQFTVVGSPLTYPIP